MLAPKTSHQSPLRPIPRPKLRILLVSDSRDALQQLHRRLRLTRCEITGVSSLAELASAAQVEQDLAIIDVGSEQIAPVLQTLREGNVLNKIPVLVQTTRLNNEMGVAGVLPTYRAMPCSHTELQTLLRYYDEPRYDSLSSGRGVL